MSIAARNGKMKQHLTVKAVGGLLVVIIIVRIGLPHAEFTWLSNKTLNEGKFVSALYMT